MLDYSQAAVQPIEHMLERLEVGAAFGQATTTGAVTVIPVAAIALGFGYGAGGGSAPAGAEQGSGGGGGGGGGGRAEPRGYIKITPEGVKFESITDQGRIALAGIAMAAWNVFWISATIRAALRRKAEQAPSP
jgi:uncharacterized spore protein YtfJ